MEKNLLALTLFMTINFNINCAEYYEDDSPSEFEDDEEIPYYTPGPVEYQRCIPKHEAEMKALQDVAYNYPELEDKYPALCRHIINLAAKKYSEVQHHAPFGFRTTLVDQEAMFEYINKRLTKEEAKKLPKRKFPHTGYGKSLVKTTCNHIFHKNCIKPQIKDYSSKCPLCNNELSIDDLTYARKARLKDDGNCAICLDPLRENKGQYSQPKKSAAAARCKPY